MFPAGGLAHRATGALEARLHGGTFAFASPHPHGLVGTSSPTDGVEGQDDEYMKGEIEACNVVPS